MTTAPQKDALVVFASRETVDALIRAVQAAVVAARDLADIDVLVNGNAALATEFSKHTAQLASNKGGAKIRVWSLALADKAQAWNRYVQDIWSGEPIAFFIDGYVRLRPDAVALLRDAMRATDERTLGGSGVPSVGRTASAMRQQMMAQGGFHGNFCAIKGGVIAQMRARGIVLPQGLYRVDSLMGAFLSFGLHPELGVWEPKRIVIAPDATWLTDEKHWWRPSDIRAKWRQMARQARGALENAAVKDHFVGRKQSPETLLPTANALVQDWATRRPQELQRILSGNYLARREWAKIAKGTPALRSDSAPVRIDHGVPDEHA